jgi:GNAT superfamily N-acetyltransferase
VTSSRFPELLELCRKRYLEAVSAFPGLPDVSFIEDWEAGTHGRHFAFFDPSTTKIAVSPRLALQPRHRQDGVLRHELGHLVHETAGRKGLIEKMGNLSKSDEVLADQIATFIWKEPIYYDAEEVQTTDPNQAAFWPSGRPSHLPNPSLGPVTFEEGESPLEYQGQGKVLRLSLCAENVEERDEHPYFVNLDPCVVGFLDFEFYGGDSVFIHYMKTREEHTGRGVARKLVEELYRRHRGAVKEPHGMMNWGQLMHPGAQALYRDMKERHPALYHRGKFW